MSKIKKSQKRIPQYRAIALANAFAVASSSNKKPAKLIDAVHAARAYDKEFGTNFIPRIANQIGREICFTKKLKVSDLKPSKGLAGRIHDAFKTLSHEMEEAIQNIGQANKDRQNEPQIIRQCTRFIAPPPHEMHRTHIH